MLNKVTIVIPALNQLAYTQGCINCLQQDALNGARVIVVDNGSTDGTADWLLARGGVELIQNPSNRGCAVAWNQGARLAGALSESKASPDGGGPDWLIIMNNDVLLPRGWLSALLSAADRHGLDIASPGMREMEMNYDFAEYASVFMQRLAGVVRRGVASGVCFAVRPSVFSKIGGFDEGFQIGQYEDEDFFRRARLAGLRLGIVGGCFIHHFGSVTQKSLGATRVARPYEAENRAYFRRKWRLGLVRRKWEKIGLAIRALWWKTTERLRYGHTLHEKWIRGRLHFY